MIPSVSSTPVLGSFVEKQNRRTLPMIDFEDGSEQLNQPTAGLTGYTWTAESDGTRIWVYRDGVEPVTVHTDSGITQIALGFDQSMRPHLAYVAGGVTKFKWFDTALGDWAVMAIPGATTPRLTTDEKRANFMSDSDLLISYKKGTDLVVRVQRERFQTEHILATGIEGDLVIFGLNDKNRLQWKLVGAEP